MVFLAGGITGCYDWQGEVIKELQKYGFNDSVVVMSPRCEDFDISDPTAAIRQIEWEYRYLSDMDIFSMYFCGGESIQPICMYELGRYISDMCHRFPVSVKDRVIVSIEDGYKREFDVVTQTNLALSFLQDIVYQQATPVMHAERIARRITRIC